jgi:hypothetical protein
MSERVVWTDHPIASVLLAVCEECGLALGSGLGCRNCACARRHMPVLVPEVKP